MKERNIKIDILKGIAIILMIVGHILQYSIDGIVDCFNNELFIFIYSFHMPLFALISGYLFYKSKDKPLKELFLGKARSLLYPILIITIIEFYLWRILGALNGSFSPLLSAGWIDNLNGYWFLWSLFASMTVIIIVEKIIKFKHKYLFFILLIPLLYFFPNGDYNFFIYVFFLIGYTFNIYKDKLKNINWLKYIKYSFLLIFPLLFMFWSRNFLVYVSGMITTKLSMLTKQLYYDTFRIIFGLSGSIYAICMVDIMLNIFNKKSKIITFLINIGQKSLQIYLIQRIVVEFFFNLMCKQLYKYSIIYYIYSNSYILYTFIILSSIICIYICVKIEQLIKKLNISKYLFGR